MNRILITEASSPISGLQIHRNYDMTGCTLTCHFCIMRISWRDCHSLTPFEKALNEFSCFQIFKQEKQEKIRSNLKVFFWWIFDTFRYEMPFVLPNYECSSFGYALRLVICEDDRRSPVDGSRDSGALQIWTRLQIAILRPNGKNLHCRLSIEDFIRGSFVSRSLISFGSQKSFSYIILSKH